MRVIENTDAPLQILRVELKRSRVIQKLFRLLINTLWKGRLSHRRQECGICSNLGSAMGNFTAMLPCKIAKFRKRIMPIQLQLTRQYGTFINVQYSEKRVNVGSVK